MHKKRFSSLAIQVAQALDDMHSLPQHERFVSTFPASVIQKNLAKALSYSDEEVLVSRAAIFMGLMKGAGYDRNTRYQRRR